MIGKEKAEGQVTVQIHELSEILGEMEKVVCALDAQLVPVLNVYPQVKQNENEKPIQELVPLANSLRDKVNMLHRLVAALNEMHHRIEL